MRRACIPMLLLLACGASANRDSNSEFGLVERRGGSLYFHSAQSGLEPGRRVQLLDSNEVLYVKRPLTRRPEKASVVLVRSKPAASYLLRGGEVPTLGAVPSVALVLDAGASSKPRAGFRLSHCTSSEGVHYSVWATRGAGDVRVWSAYQLLGYAVEPSCSEAEFAE